MEKFLTVEEVSGNLQVHWQTVLSFIKNGKLRAVKLGRGYRIDPKDFADFIEEMKTKK
jgi:excisionase family DNA binding protein